MARLAANALPMAASQLVSSVLLLVSLVLVARVLGPQEYGLFAIGLALFGMTAFVSDAGLGMWGIRVIADDPDHWATIGRLWAGRAITVTLALLVGGLAISILPLPLGSAAPAFVMIVAVVPVGFGLEYALIGLERTGRVALVRIATSMTVLVLSPALAGRFESIGAAAGYLIAACVGCAASWVLFTAVAGKPRLHRPDRVIETLKHSFPMGVNSVIGQVYKQSDGVLTGAILGATAAGIYAAPVRLLTAISAFGWVIGASLLPIYRSLDAEGHERTAALATNATRLLILACIPGLAVVIGGANVIVVGILGPAYAASTSILAVAAIGAGLTLCMSPIGYAILARRYDRRYTAATAASAIVAIPTALILALWTRDIRGVAVAMLIGEVASAIVLFIGARRSGLRLGRLGSVVVVAAFVGLVGAVLARSVPGGIVGVIVVGLIVEIPFAVSIAHDIKADRRLQFDQPATVASSGGLRPSTDPDR